MSDFLREVREGVDEVDRREAAEAIRRVAERDAARRRVADRICEIIGVFDEYKLSSVGLWEWVVTGSKFVPAHWSYKSSIPDSWQDVYGLQYVSEVYPLYQEDIYRGGVVAVSRDHDVYVGGRASNDVSRDGMRIPDSSLILRNIVVKPTEAESMLLDAPKALIHRIRTGSTPNYTPDLR